MATTTAPGTSRKTSLVKPNSKAFIRSKNSFQSKGCEQFTFREHLLSQANKRVLIKKDEKEAFYFVFCCQNQIVLKNSLNKSKTLSAFQSALFYDKKGEGFSINAINGEKTKVWVIKMAYDKSGADGSYQFFKNFKNNFFNHVPLQTTIFIGKPIFDLVEKLEKLSKLSKKNIAAELIIQGLILEVFGRKMEQVLNLKNEVDTGTLSLKDIEEIKAVSKVIAADPGGNYCVLTLCKTTGLSAGKLQEGFKMVFNRTVMDYVREMRLEMATELMRTTEMNISEIVYTIGFTSRSYFSKIFKRKYKCSPKYYQDMIQKRSEVA